MVKKLILVVVLLAGLVVSGLSVSYAYKGVDPGEQMGPCSNGCND